MELTPSANYDILFRSFARYLEVTPNGFRLPDGKRTPSLACQILSFRPARSLYQNRKPVCRSLDAIRSLKEGRSCSACLLRSRCTPQIYLELLADGIPLNLLLAYTSAKNFLTWHSSLKQQGLTMENVTVWMTVLDRGRWGEVRFNSKPLQKN